LHKKQAEVLPQSPSPREGAFVGLVPPKQSFKPPQLKYKI